MSLLDAINGLQTLHAGLTGVASAPAVASYPDNASRGAVEDASLDFPLVLTFPAEGTWPSMTARGGRRTRTVDVLLLVGRLGRDEDVSATLQSFLTVAEALGSAYLDPDNSDLGNGWHIVRATGATDAGWSELNYAGTLVRGTLFQLDVQQLG